MSKSDFKSARTNLQQVRQDAERNRIDLFLAREKLARIQAEQAWLDRIYNESNPTHRARRKQLNQQARDAQTLIRGRETAHAENKNSLLDKLAAFARFSDPLKVTENLSDEYPFLMFPLRIETRFKQLQRDNGIQHQLWVRVYPDDVAIDTFEPALSESEVKSAQLYWTEIWRSGGDEDRDRAAWRALVASYGSGRAAWILEHYHAPLNLDQKPKKAKSTDIILVIATDTPLEGVEKTATDAYWQAHWRADGKRVDQDKAHAAFVAALDGDANRAAAIIEQYRPFNLTDTPVASKTKAEVDVLVATVVFPKADEINTKRDSWTQAARVNVMPDRFVLVGIRDGEKVPPILFKKPVPSPLIVGPDPSAPEDEQLRQDNGEIIGGEEIRWMFDFDRAIDSGMGLKVDLTPEEYERGFDRLLVIGLRLSSDEQESKALLETLIHNHHYSRKGFSLIPQGTPTNNVEDKGAGFSYSEDADESYADYVARDSLFEDTDDWLEKRDGQWLAECLGIDSAVFKKVRHSGGRDQLEARAMNIALWPATLGYFMDTMMAPVFDDETIAQVRWFFTYFVSGRGMVPAVRIGKQPYGILPTTVFSRMAWGSRDRYPIRGLTFLGDPTHFFTKLHGVLTRVDKHWEELLGQVAYVGKPGDAHQILLDILGLHSGTVEYYQAYAESNDHLHNLLKLDALKTQRVGGIFPIPRRGSAQRAGTQLVATLMSEANTDAGRQLLRELGYTGEEDPEILEQIFLNIPHELDGPVIDDRPLSETEKIRVYTDVEQDRQFVSEQLDGFLGESEPNREAIREKILDTVASTSRQFVSERLDAFLGEADPGLRDAIRKTILAKVGKNYIQWLYDEAKVSLENIRLEKGFTDNQPPRALLYIMLRHAITLGYWDTGLRLYENANALTGDDLRLARQEPKFIHIAEEAKRSESRWHYLYRVEREVTGQDDVMVAHYIPEALRRQEPGTNYLAAQLSALAKLQDVATAPLERAFAEHIDCLSCRLDAWKLGLVHYKLASMRLKTRKREMQQGLYLGMYGWLEDVRPEARTLTEVQLDSELNEKLNTEDSPLMRDSANAGYILAPSLNQAVTAAVLLSGYRANATSENPETLSIDLSSERVRRALGVLEGIRNGQSLGALLGYRIERGLHDSHNLAQVDKFIYGLRKAFPLVGDRFADTKAPDDESIEAIEARNVMNGLDLVNHINETKDASERRYPFGKELPEATPAEADAINAEVERLLDLHDALADLAMAEGIHQVVQGNRDRAAATLDAYGKANFPPVPEVAQTPGSGITLTHRVALHFESGLAPDANPFAANGNPPMTPRAKAEPAINKWLAQILPAPDTVACRAEYRATDGSLQQPVITQANLGLQPIDLLYLLTPETQQAMTALDDKIVHHVFSLAKPPRPDSLITISYRQREHLDGNIPFFELAALIRSLRALILRSRPLVAGDGALVNEATSRMDEGIALDKKRITSIKTPLATIKSDLRTFETTRQSQLDDLAAAREAILTKVPSAEREAVATLLDDFFVTWETILTKADSADRQDVATKLEEFLMTRETIFAKVDSADRQFVDTQLVDFLDAPDSNTRDAIRDTILTKVPDAAHQSVTTQLERLLATRETILTKVPNTDRQLVTTQLSSLCSIRDTILATVVSADSQFISTQLSSIVVNMESILNDIDVAIDHFTALFADAADYGLPQTGFGFVYNWKRNIFRRILGLVDELVNRWQDRLDRFASLMADYDAATRDEKFVLLQRAESLVSTSLTSPLPAAPEALKAVKAVVDTKGDDFAAKKSVFETILNTNDPSLAHLHTAIIRALPVYQFDFTGVDLTEVEAEILRFVGNLVLRARQVADDLQKRLDAVEAQLETHKESADPRVQVQALLEAGAHLLGEDFRMVPQFRLGREQADEWEQALGAVPNLLHHLTHELEIDFPVDDWLYGVARVREKMRHWENVTFLTQAFGKSEPVLLPIQLPYKADDSWLALPFPQRHEPDGDRLLYTSHFATVFDKLKPQCGLLLDEWTEVIPTKEETTGLTFHFDGPNTEPPQTMLLVTPPKFEGRWSWDNVVDAVSETLDLAKLRAIEPGHIEDTPFARFLPATLMAATKHPITIAANLAVNIQADQYLVRMEDE